MFGYVTPLKPELKVRELNRFQGYYCGLCMQIKKDYGNIPRMALNYDMTFLALLLDGLVNDIPKMELKRCVAHPARKKPMAFNTKALDYAAAMNVSLAYFKLIDDSNDDKSLKAKVGASILSPYKKKFSESVSKINDIIRDNLKKLSELEDNKSFSSIDEICDPFSLIVANILKEYPYELKEDSEDIRNTLYNLGYCLGKWIYIIDALDDLEKDMEKNKFNPINFLYNKDNLSYEELKEQIKSRIEFSILNCACTCKESLSNLPLNRNKELLENIIELGMMDKYINVINNCNQCSRRTTKHESI